MANPFARTTRALSRDSGALASVTLLTATAFLVAWLSWVFLGTVPLYEVSHNARLEASEQSRAVAAPVSGQVVAVAVGLNDRVAEGDVLVRLAPNPEDPGREEADAEVREVMVRLSALREELSELAVTSERSLLIEEQERAAASAALAAAEARAEFAASSAERASALHAAEVLSRAEAERSLADARAAAGEVAAARAAVERLRYSHELSAKQREMAEADLLRRISEAEARLEARRARAERIAVSSDRSTIRAPVAGVVGGLAEALTTGTVLAHGDPVAWIVPDGRLRVVADFPQQAMGRIRTGQTARLRLDGFPWTEFGVLNARVSAVGRQPRAGSFRLEMTLLDAPSRIPTSHGLAGNVEVEVERVRPYVLLLRAAGMSRTPRYGERPESDG